MQQMQKMEVLQGTKATTNKGIPEIKPKINSPDNSRS